MALLKSDFFHSDLLRKAMPHWVKDRLKRYLPMAQYRSEQCRRQSEAVLGGTIQFKSDYQSPYPLKVGIFKDSSFYFVHHVAACRELRVAYKVLDIEVSQWVDVVNRSQCDVFLVSPSTLLTVWRHLYDERLRCMVEDLKKIICPSYNELWLWESKRRMRDWLLANQIPYPRTEIFYNIDLAREFVSTANFPIVCKTDIGAASNGVFVIRSRREGQRTVRKAFRRGLRPRGWDSRDNQYGFILFQEFVPHEAEWRIVRIGDSYLCRKKWRQGDFASGSGRIGWAKPLPGMLDFVRRLTEKGHFRSMAVDLFENPVPTDGADFLVNELQCLFGAIVDESNTNEHTGRWLRDSETGEWHLEKGYFYQNACANLRLEMVLNDLGFKTLH